MDSSAGAPDPLEGGDARPEREWASGNDWPSETERNPDEDGPFYAWLPPEDRLWRHPSEGAAGLAGTGRGGLGTVGHRVTGASGRVARRGTWAVALIAGLVGATAATGIGMASGLWPQQTTVVRTVQPATSSVSLADIGPEPTNWTAVDDSVAASVVTVSVDGSAGPQIGSGIVFLQSGGGSAYVVTDRSLFAEGEDMGYIGTIQVTFLSGTTLRARLLGEDRPSGLAVLDIAGAAQAVPAALGSIADLQEAQQVLAVGSRSAPSVSTGSISSEDHTVRLADGSDIDSLLAVSMPPLSATASGGPLLNQFGQVVGVTLSLDPIDPADRQFTFAVPIDEVSRVTTELIDGVPVSHPWIGVSDAGDLPSTMAHQLGLDGGVQVGTVVAGSPALAAGLRADDVITSMDGRPVVSTGALLAQITSCTPGRTVALTYVHAGHTVQTSMRVGNEPNDS